MAEDNVELLRHCVTAWNSGDVEGFLAFFDPRCEVVFRPDVPEPGPFRGRDALRKWVDGFLIAWESHNAEVGAVSEVGNQVVATLHLKGQGRGSDLGFEQSEGHVFEFRDGFVLRWHNYSTHEEALEAAQARNSGAAR